eukprot:1203324-Alexandrium_andersonii.AAC.1
MSEPPGFSAGRRRRRASCGTSGTPDLHYGGALDFIDSEPRRSAVRPGGVLGPRPPWAGLEA